MSRQLTMERGQWEQMMRHVQAHLPLEACGLLAGRDGRVEAVIEVRNQAQSPVRFVMEPREQLKAFDWIESNGLELLGIFHSHPAGPESVSATDIAEAAYAVVQIVCSRRGGEWQARAYWIETGRATEVSLRIEV